MMHLQTETEKMVAKALHDAGQSDREIADACATSVNNVIWWRREQQLRENGATVEEASTPIVRKADEYQDPLIRTPVPSLAGRWT